MWRKLIIHDSTNIEMVEYSLSSNQMIVSFVSGDKYCYDGVEPEIFAMLVVSSSIGQYFNTVIKKYSCHKMV